MGDDKRDEFLYKFINDGRVKKDGDPFSKFMNGVKMWLELAQYGFLRDVSFTLTMPNLLGW